MITMQQEFAEVREVPALEMNGVSWRAGRHTVLSDVSLAVKPGELLGLIGPNGSGKSSVLRILAGIHAPTQGTVHLHGHSLRAMGRRQVARQLAMVAQTADTLDAITARDAVELGRTPWLSALQSWSARDDEIVSEALRCVGMHDRQHRLWGQLSGGERQRIHIARALAQQAQVILLDEPFTGVDVTTEDAIIALLRTLRDEGRVMLVSTHNLGSVPEFCDRTVLVKNTVLAHGETEQVFTRANLEAAFGGVLRHFDLPQAPGSSHTLSVGIMTDDERPLVMVGGRSTRRGGPESVTMVPDGEDGAP